MESYYVLANMYAQARLHDVAYSALPDAPTLPVAHRRRRAQRLIAVARAATQRTRQRSSAQPSRAPERDAVASTAC